MQTKISKVNTRKAADDGFIKWPSTHLSQRNGFFSFYSLFIHISFSVWLQKHRQNDKERSCRSCCSSCCQFRFSCTFDRNIPAFCQNFPSAMSLQDVFFRAPLGHTTHFEQQQESRQTERQADGQLQAIRGRSCRHRLVCHIKFFTLICQQMF